MGEWWSSNSIVRQHTCAIYSIIIFSLLFEAGTVIGQKKLSALQVVPRLASSSLVVKYGQRKETNLNSIEILDYRGVIEAQG